MGALPTSDISNVKIIQGGMGAGVSDWRLAKAVSKTGQLGVVSGTACDLILARRLQDGDVDGRIRYALANFPFRKMACRALDKYFIPGGRQKGQPYRLTGMHTLKGNRGSLELCILGNFMEIFLARQGHNNPVGINYLEKIQFPLLASIYGAMLAGVEVVIIGAGIPSKIAGILDELAYHRAVSYPIQVAGALKEELEEEKYCVKFDPADYNETGTSLPPLIRPLFYPIVSLDFLAKVMIKRTNGRIDGFVVEGPDAGGHNAPPRKKGVLDENSEPTYGPDDICNLEVMRKLGKPFWLAGSYGSAEGLRLAQSQGAAGIQVGTLFAFCTESRIDSCWRKALLLRALEGRAKVYTDFKASPTGYPFKVASLEESLSEPNIYAERHRACDLRYLCETYRKENGSVGYRCSAEPIDDYAKKGGKQEDTVGRKCLCNALMANVDLGGIGELPLITLGDDYAKKGFFERVCSKENLDYTAADAIRVLLG